MMTSPPGCSPNQRLTSSTIPSMQSHTPPAALCATISSHAYSRSLDAYAPRRCAHQSPSVRHPKVSAAAESVSVMRMSYIGGGFASSAASRKMSTRSKTSVSTSISTSTRLSPISPARRTAPVSAMHWRNNALCTGNISPSRVVTCMISRSARRILRSWPLLLSIASLASSSARTYIAVSARTRPRKQ